MVKKSIGRDALNKRSREDFEWLIDARRDVSRLLLSLHELSKKPRVLKESGFQSLVTAAFSLWRAAFLVRRGRKWQHGVRETKKVLFELLAHNRIAYEQEVSSPDWFVGFYVTLAEVRADLAARRLNFRGRSVTAIAAVAKRVKHGLKPSMVPMQRRWEDAYQAANEVCGWLQKEYGVL